MRRELRGQPGVALARLREEDGAGGLDVEPLVDEDDYLSVCFFQIGFQPLELTRRHVRVGPREVVSAIGLAVAVEAGVEDDKVPAGCVERVIARLPLNAGQDRSLA